MYKEVIKEVEVEVIKVIREEVPVEVEVIKYVPVEVVHVQVSSPPRPACA